jgi:ElaA protein
MTSPTFKIKRFNELSTTELYQVLRLREKVFIVEQNCVYEDIDGKDGKALHLVGASGGKIIAYARLFKPGDYLEKASIGRVVVAADFRALKIGHMLMREAISGIEENFREKEIWISAQLYLQRFYESHGFVAVGESYLEDGIPHMEMRRN